MSEIVNNLHKLTRITLINWYLFDSIDIPIEGDSILFRGANGSGKSSIIDALQTILVGGDENQLMMNAASSDGKRSGRSIRSYVLGEVAESPGQKACEPRSESNCYICLSFMSKTGKPFVFGLGIYAKANDTRSLPKYPFIIEGNDLSCMDFMRDEHTVLPWKSFEQRVATMPGKLSLPTSAKEYRQQYCELMSAPGARNTIAPDMMFRAVRNGLTFKPQRDISEFARKYILPENDIDVIRIENDYREYRRIQEIIVEARDRLAALNPIIKRLNSYKNKLALTLAYKWAEHEACFFLADMAVERLEEKGQRLSEELESLTARIDDLNEKTPALGEARDKAMLAHKSSASQQAINACNDRITEVQKNIEVDNNSLAQARCLLANIEQAVIPASASDRLKERFRQARQQLISATGFNGGLIQPWPIDTDNIDQTLAALEEYKALTATISDERDILRSEFEKIEFNYRAVEEALKKSSAGKSSLMHQTETMISLLANQGVEVIPVCDLATITDESWQMGIERFLGSNREALVVINRSTGSPSGKDAFDRAISIYRRAKDENATLRSVKLINPDKVFGSDEIPPVGTAGYLIESDNPVALRYLRGLLHNVRLVETEQQLRKEKRAITRDGMVAGNGTISGGNQFHWILIGQEARKRHAVQLAEELKSLAPEYDQQKNYLREIDRINNTFAVDIVRAIDQCVTARQCCERLTGYADEWRSLKDELQRLESSGGDALRIAYESAQQVLDLHTKEIEQANTNKTRLELKLKQINDDLPTRKATRDSAGNNRRKATEELGFDQSEANRVYETLTEEYGEDEYARIQEAAIKQHNTDSHQSLADRENGLKALVEFASRYDTEDKDELLRMEPIPALERCREHAERIENAEIIGYLSDAEVALEKMLSSFRSEVVAKLKECFNRIDDTFKTLNRTLSDLTFNSNKYQFIWPLVNIPTLKTVHDYVTDTSDLELESVGDMFDTSREHPAVKIIQDILVDGRLHEISDYRNFYSYDIVSTNIETETKRKFSELLSVGSGGEQQAPFYVALGASFMTAYKIRKVGNSVLGGAAIAIFDEAFSKMDGNNAKAALRFFSDIGLQVILAAPPESEIKVGPYVDKAFSVIRSGDTIYLDHKAYKTKGRKLLESDNPHINPSIVDGYVDGVKAELSIE